jgi:hypothetical protein
MRYIKRFLKSGAFLGVGILTVILSMFTVSAGRGQSPQCGYRADLHACRHCGWKDCLSCWQSKGKYSCPDCGRASP